MRAAGTQTIFDALEDVADEPWFLEAKDKDPRPEISRQALFLSRLAIFAPAVDAVAIPNSGKLTNWERLQRHREGARAGALDLLITWEPTGNERGVFFAEFKSGTGMPDRNQRERLNRYHRQGHGCGVYRNPDTLLAHLREAGAPFIGWYA